MRLFLCRSEEERACQSQAQRPLDSFLQGDVSDRAAARSGSRRILQQLAITLFFDKSGRMNECEVCRTCLHELSLTAFKDMSLDKHDYATPASRRQHSSDRYIGLVTS